MKNILLVGANSATSKNLIENYENKYNFIKMSRNSEFSDVENFDLLNEKTYHNSNIELNGIVYFPGTINLKQFERLKIEDFEEDLNINVIGLIKILKYYKKQLQKKSSIVLFSTVATKLGMPYHCSTSMVKSAINGITLSLAAEWAPNIRVNCISPSLFKSHMSSRLFSSEKSIERISNNHPLKRTGNTKDISTLINFLLSEDSSWITGQNISIDGGLSTLKI
tara:strand:- start:55 stop:723 length:669 start_codon:yes stop_codon:yes gene_type:complete